MLENNNIEKAKDSFKNVMLHCYLKQVDKYPDFIYWIYNPLTHKQLSLNKKLNKINGIRKEIIIKPKPGDKLIFEQDFKNGYFYIKYSGYWLFLETNFNLNYDEIKELTTGVVNEVLNSKQYTTVGVAHSVLFEVNEVLNSKQYTTLFQPPSQVNEVLNSKQDAVGL